MVKPAHRTAGVAAAENYAKRLIDTVAPAKQGVARIPAVGMLAERRRR